MILAPLFLTTLLYAGLAWLLLSLTRRLVGDRAIWLVGLLLAGFVVYWIVDAKTVCDAAPKFLPPDCDDTSGCGDGSMIFACDGPDGAMAYGFIYLFGPLTVGLTLILTYLIAKRPSLFGKDT